MKVEIRLKKLLQDNNLYRRGVEQEIADFCDLHRHTIGKLMRNDARNPSLEVLGKVCEWLHRKGIRGLPGILFGFRPSGLWKALGESNNVSIYLGMYTRPIKDPFAAPAWMSVARHDVAVATKLTHTLSDQAVMGEIRPVVRTHYVLFEYGAEAADLKGQRFAEDKRRAKDIFKSLRNPERQPESSIILGSQRANYLTECYVADLFNAEPFKPPSKTTRVPFYLYYRDFDWAVPSCFGGAKAPPRFRGAAGPGLFYVDTNGKWLHYEWKRLEQDGGVVIMVHDAGVVEMLVFGFSGRATYAIGHKIAKNPGIFMQSGEKSTNTRTKAKHFSGIKRKGKEISVFVCCVTFKENQKASKTWSDEDYKNDAVEVIPLSQAVLKKYIS